jgi:large subunit ribosomal protein L30
VAGATKANSTIQVTLRRSLIGEKPKTRQTVKGLGLGKMHSTVELPDNPSVRGMIHAVRHLVEVSEDGSRSTEAASPEGGRRKSQDDRRKRRRAKKNQDE